MAHSFRPAARTLNRYNLFELQPYFVCPRVADTVDSDTARRHMERMPVVRATGDSANAATKLTRDVRPRRVVDVGATERRRREVAASSSIISISRASETHGPAGRDVRRSKYRRRIAGRSLTRVQSEDRQTVWYHVPVVTLTSSACGDHRLRGSTSVQ